MEHFIEDDETYEAYHRARVEVAEMSTEEFLFWLETCTEPYTKQDLEYMLRYMEEANEFEKCRIINEKIKQ